MEILKTYIGMKVKNSPSTLVKIHELNLNVFVIEYTTGLLEFIDDLSCDKYIDNMMIYLDNK